MNGFSSLLYNLRCFLSVVIQLLWYAARFCRDLLLPKAVLVARLTASESQLRELTDRVRRETGGPPRFRFRPAFRIVWVVFSKLLEGWEASAHLMRPETVVSWHRSAFRTWWRWRSKPGRKPVAAEMQQLIRRLSQENPLWRAERIRYVLLLMGYEAPGEDTVRKYMVKPRKPRPATTNWLSFLRNHLDVSWAIDFLTVTTLGFQVLYVVLVLDHARREVLHLAITPHPTMEWVIQQLREATPFGCQPRFLFRDNDGIYGYGVAAFLISCGILEVRTAYQSFWQNLCIERFIGTLRRELLDHVIVLNQAHMERLLKEFIKDYYHPARPHQGLRGETPVPQAGAPTGKGELISVPVLGGRHHRYYRAAA